MTNRRRVLHARGDGKPVFRTCRKFACRADVYTYPGPDDSDQAHTSMATVSLIVDTDGSWTVSHRPAWAPGVERPFPNVVAAGTADGPQGSVVVTVPQMNNGLPTLVAFAVPLSASLAHGGQPWTFEEADAVKLGPPTVIGPEVFPGAMFTREQVSAAFNSACDDVLEHTDDGQEDALNLLLNAGLTYLDTPGADLHKVVEECYDQYPEILAGIDPGDDTCEECGLAEGDTNERGDRIEVDPASQVCQVCTAYNVSRS